MYIVQCIPAHQDLSLFSYGVSLLISFRFPTTYGAHTRAPATSRASGGLTESILDEDRHCSSLSSQVSYRQMSVESESPEGL